MKDIPTWKLINWMTQHSELGYCMFPYTGVEVFSIGEVRAELARRRENEYKTSS